MNKVRLNSVPSPTFNNLFPVQRLGGTTKMKYLIFLFLIILFYNSKAQLHDVAISVQNINDSCNYGEQIILRDTNKDSVYDFIRRSFCDFSNKDDSLLVFGNGEILSGMTGDLLEGSFESNYFKIKIIDPFTETTYAYIEYDSSNNVAVLRFIPTAIELPLENELELFPNPAHNYVYLKINGICSNKIEIYNEMGTCTKIVNISNTREEIDVSDLSTGLYFIKINNILIKFLKE